MEGDFLASASHTGRIHVFELPSGDLISEFGDAESAHGVSFSPDGRLLAVGGGYTDEKLRSSGLVNVWDWREGRKKASFAGHALFVRSIAFMPSDDRLLSVGIDGNAKLWDVQTGYELLGFDAPGIFCAAGAVSPDGLVIALADEEGRIHFWEAARKEE
jgi:WD40 repeat protein